MPASAAAAAWPSATGPAECARAVPVAEMRMHFGRKSPTPEAPKTDARNQPAHIPSWPRSAYPGNAGTALLDLGATIEARRDPKLPAKRRRSVWLDKRDAVRSKAENTTKVSGMPKAHAGEMPPGWLGPPAAGFRAAGSCTPLALRSMPRDSRLFARGSVGNTGRRASGSDKPADLLAAKGAGFRAAAARTSHRRGASARPLGAIRPAPIPVGGCARLPGRPRAPPPRPPRRGGRQPPPRGREPGPAKAPPAAAGGRAAPCRGPLRKFNRQGVRGMPVDDFERDYPDFDWRNTPAYKHPGGKDCPCPKHEYVREQINYTKQVNAGGKDKASVTLRFCPDHYRVYVDEVVPSMPFKYRMFTKIALRVGAIRVVRLGHMQSDICFYCKFGSGGYGKKTELPPV